MPRIPTAPVAAAALILGYAVAVASGSRSLGAVVLALGGLWCVHRWLRDHGRRTAGMLTVFGLIAFAASHVLAQVIGAWPAVIMVSAAAALVIWLRADARSPARRAPLPPAPAAPGAAPGAGPTR